VNKHITYNNNSFFQLKHKVFN